MSQQAPRRRTQRERVDESSRRLLEAAAELVAEQGYHATTAAQIGERAGYSRELVRVRFGSKQALLEHLLRSEYETEQLASQLPEHATGLDHLRAALDRLADMAKRSPTVLRAVFTLQIEAATSIPALAPHARGWVAETERAMRRALKAGVNDGSIRPEVDPAATARQLAALSIGSAYLYVLHDGPDDPSELLRAAVEALAAPDPDPEASPG